MAFALLPVLLLGLIQATLAFRKDADERRTALALAAERSAHSIHARIEGAGVLLDTLAPQIIDFDCAQRLADVAHRLTGYDNLVRFDAFGRVRCAAAAVATDPGRSSNDWFSRLRGGAPRVVVQAPEGLSGRGPALLIAERMQDGAGVFDGAFAAVINIADLRPEVDSAILPPDTQVAVADGQGRFLLCSRTPCPFAHPPSDFAMQARKAGSVMYARENALGEPRVYSAAPLEGNVFIILSTPSAGWLSWAQLNPLSSIALPLLAFAAVLAATFVVAERVVVQWLQYLQRIAAIYAKGRFSVHPVQAEHAPPEIRDLARTLDSMATTISSRDASLMNSLAQKDALMREIHHRVKNNLQVISSLINIQQRTLVDPTARDAMTDMRQRVSAIALIYRALYEGSDLKRVDLRQFLSDLIGQLVGDWETRQGAMRSDLEADELIIDPDKLAPLALFAVEAISNAQTHALAHREGAIHVKFLVLGDEAELQIADEGSGQVPNLKGKGVGRALMSAFARQLHGRVELELNAQGGVTARLIFPTPIATGARIVRFKPGRNRTAA